MVDSHQPFLSWSGTFGATIAVLLTTLDDSVWLVSYMGSSHLNQRARWVHARTFLASLCTLSILCCIVALGAVQVTATTTNSENLEIVLEAIAAGVCWILAIGFFVKKMLKRRRWRLERENNASMNVESDSYGAVAQSFDAEQQQTEDDDDSDDDSIKSTSCQPWAVVSLTTIGFLDEISYFPTLIIGGIFTPWELCLATLLAGLILLAIQVFLATQGKPLIDFLDDNVPLYGIIAAFALVLTVHLVWDLVTVESGR